MTDLTKYTELIANQHKGAARFVETIELSAIWFVALQNLISSMPKEFDIDEAVGVQLDQIGLWVGQKRSVKIPLTGVYFTWGSSDPNEGWGLGAWKGQFDPDTGIVSLNDDDYRFLLKAKIAANHWDGTVPRAYEVWNDLFGDDVIIQDNQDMSMSLGITNPNLSAVMRSLLSNGYLQLKPQGVRINYYFVVPPASEGAKIFAWGAQSSVLGGWGESAWATTLFPSI